MTGIFKPFSRAVSNDDDDTVFLSGTAKLCLSHIEVPL